MLRIAICDDNNAVCSELETIILEYSKKINTFIEVDIFLTGESLITNMENENHFDLILLDIELGTTTGIDVGYKIRNDFENHISKIVFISSQMGYERRLFEIQPLNFLDKPIDKEKLFSCIDLTIKILDKEKKIFNYKVGHSFKQVLLSDVIYFENKLRKIKIHKVDGIDEFYDTLKNIKEQLPKIFIEPHNSYIVNYNYIRIISNEKILLLNDEEIPISKKKLKAIHNLQITLMKEMRNNNV